MVFGSEKILLAGKIFYGWFTGFKTHPKWGQHLRGIKLIPILSFQILGYPIFAWGWQISTPNFESLLALVQRMTKRIR
jgi:hypothetical protein